MKANNIATIIEDSTEFFPTRFKECTAQIWESILTMDYVMISFILLNLPDILLDFS